jgi:hypothetical protein
VVCACQGLQLVEIVQDQGVVIASAGADKNLLAD